MADGAADISFSLLDYLIFISTLLASLSIGLYHGIKGKKTSLYYLMADRSMSIVPVALSFTATYVSAISIMGYVGEVYGHGLQLMWILLGQALGLSLAVHTALPVFYNLKLTSINEYLEKRFHSKLLRQLVSVLNILACLMYLGFCLYAPTLALSATTPFSVELLIPLLGVTVTVYSALGGLKAVVWTDCLQTVIIIIGVVASTIFSIVTVGGLENMWTIASRHGRTHALDFSVGVHTRHTAINTTILGFVSFFSMYGYMQATFLRVSTMPNLTSVRKVLYLNLVCLTALLLIIFLCGLGVFAVYADCDPMSLGHISSKDQLLPYFVMHYLGKIKGMPGLFVACLFSGTLSSISSFLNSAVSMIWSDFISDLTCISKLQERTKSLLNAVITALFGGAMILVAYLATSQSGVMQAAHMVHGTTNGPVCGTFLLAMLVPHCTKKGAIAGLLSSAFLMCWLATGSLHHGPTVVLLPLSTASCSNQSSVTNDTFLVAKTFDDIHQFFGISYTYYALIGMISCVTIGCLVTLLTGGNKLKEVHPKLVFGFWKIYITDGEDEEELAELEEVTRKTAD